MLIASRFKRPNAPINLPNADGTTKDYFFRPVDPASPESEHVAEVTDAGHIQKLLSIAEGYYVAEANAALDAAKTLAASGARPVAQPTEPVPAPAQPDAAADQPQPSSDTETQQDDQGTDESTPAGDVSEAAAALLELSLAKFKAALAETPKPVLEAALSIETAKGADERATVVKQLKATLA